MIYLHGCKHSHSWQLGSAIYSLYTKETWCTKHSQGMQPIKVQKHDLLKHTGSQWMQENFSYFLLGLVKCYSCKVYLTNLCTTLQAPNCVFGRIDARVYQMSPNSPNTPFWECISQVRMQGHGPHTLEIPIAWYWCILSDVQPTSIEVAWQMQVFYWVGKQADKHTP